MKILLLDDHKLFGQSIKTLLEEQEEIEICDYVWSFEDFLKCLKKKQYDILLLDINLNSDKTGLDLIEELQEKELTDTKIVILTSYDLLNYRDMAYKLGVADFINKSIEIQELIFRLQSVKLGKNKKIHQNLPDPLSSREQEVLRKVLSGRTKKEIAKEMGISERTLYNHMGRIYEKLDVNNAIEAYNKALKLGYLEPFI